jgi:hypothetical protein
MASSTFVNSFLEEPLATLLFPGRIRGGRWGIDALRGSCPSFLTASLDTHLPKRFDILFFVISKIIEMRNFSILRGAYLIEISRGRIPRPSLLVCLFQMWGFVARYKMAKARMKG